MILRRPAALALLSLAVMPFAHALPLLCVPEAFGTLPWRDCNDDGHEGFGPARLNPYRAELLMDRSICPPVAGPPGSASYNDGRCIRERG